MGVRKQVEPELLDVAAEVAERLRFDAMLVDLSVKFINLPSTEVDREIGDAQRLVCECIGAEVSAMWQWDPDNPGTYHLTHLYRPLEGPPLPEPADARSLSE